MSARATLVEPQPGLVIRYAYLWRDEAERGREDGKDRPCAVVLVTRRGPDERLTVVVAPVTHSPPALPHDAIEIPEQTKKRLGLDDARSWIKTNDLNVFIWPGPDLRPVNQSGSQQGFAYGFLPASMVKELVRKILERVRNGETKPTRR